MKNTKALLGILFVFILGAASGALVTHSINNACFESFVRGGPTAREDLFVKRLTSKLDLDSHQQEQVKTIVHETHSGIAQVRNQCSPQIDSLLEQGQARVNAVLRQDQKENFRKIIAEHKARRADEHEKP
jgi:hypothetical protein